MALVGNDAHQQQHKVGQQDRPTCAAARLLYRLVIREVGELPLEVVQNNGLGKKAALFQLPELQTRAIAQCRLALLDFTEAIIQLIGGECRVAGKKIVTTLVLKQNGIATEQPLFGE